MRSLYQRVTGRCRCCGQKLKSDQPTYQRLHEINERANRMSELLGRKPQVQSCRDCQQIVFEGEKGFEPTYLLIDVG